MNSRLINDTCVEIKILNKTINKKFILAYLQSKFCNWYAYNFIYNRAIRTMDFINYYVSQLPIPKVTPESQIPFIELVDIILTKKENGEDTSIEENKIDNIIYKLYDLSEEEVSVIEGKWN